MTHQPQNQPSTSTFSPILAPSQALDRTRDWQPYPHGLGPSPNQGYDQAYLPHLPSPYNSLNPQHQQQHQQHHQEQQHQRGPPIDPSLISPEQTTSSTTFPSVMVYPPPPPEPHYPSQQSNGEPSSSTSPLHTKSGNPGTERRGSVQLPSMGSWAPPPPGTTVPHYPAYNGHAPPPMPYNGEGSTAMKRRPSDAEEVEAGMALATMAEQAKKASPRSSGTNGNAGLGTNAAKRAKKEDPKKGEKDNRKSCSECRRLKAKCDRVFPCSNCRRRGCAVVCPDGDLSCMQGKRLVLASTEQLHERIAQLEAALSQSHSKTTTTSHPLLAPQYLDGGFVNNPPPPIDDTLRELKPTPSPPLAVKSVDDSSPKDRSSASSFTLLTPRISTERSSHTSRMAVESLLLDGNKAAPEGKREDEWVGENAAPAMIVGNCGPNASSDSDDHQKIVDRLKKILRILPPREEARKRADSFWENSQWYNSMLKKEEYENVYEPAVYAPTPANPLSPHKLACVLMVLTLDTYFDLLNEEDNPVIGEYWEGAQQCFDTRFGWAASVAGVQALALATLFVGFGWRGAKASNLYWLRMMTSAAQQLGLHKDPHTSLPADERDFRRRVFWDAYSIDCLMSINHGQRTAIPLENIETAMPMKSAFQVHKLKYEYMRTVKTSVIDIGCRPDSAPASWDQISRTHEVLMGYDLKPFPGLHAPILTDQVVPPLSRDPAHMDVLAMSRCTLSMCHYKAMMFLYRPSLRRLLARLRSRRPEEQVVLTPEDQQTVSMTYTACRAITQTSLYMSRTHPRLSARCWAVWVQTFSAAVSMAALAIWCGPHLDGKFINSAYTELTEACDMIRENGSKRSQGVLSLLPILQALVQNRYPHLIGQNPNTANISVEAEDMLFALLGGQVDQRGISPQQGNLMNPPFAAYPQTSQQSRTSTSPQNSVSMLATSGPPSRPLTQSPVERKPVIEPMTRQQSNRSDEMVPSLQSSVPLGVPHNPAFAAMSSGYNTTVTTPMWQPQMMALPVVAAQPSASMEEYQAHLRFLNQQAASQQRTSSSRPEDSLNGNGFNGVGGEMGMGMDNSDLWARLQTFYEPTPAYWGQSVGGVPNYMDYTGMGMGM